MNYDQVIRPIKKSLGRHFLKFAVFSALPVIAILSPNPHNAATPSDPKESQSFTAMVSYRFPEP